MNDLSIIHPDPKTLNREARYRLSLGFVELLEQVEIGFHGRRLALGLAHAVCRETSDWHNGTAMQPYGGYRVRCADLRGRLGLQGANGNRDLVKGLDELLSVGLLARAELVTGRQWLDFHLTEYAFYHLFDPKPYGLFDIRDARDLPTPLDHVIYNRIGVIRRSSRPEITLFLDGCAAVAERSSEWSRLRPALLSTFVRVAGLFGVKLMAVCECRGTRLGIDHVTLRVVHSGTVWRAARLGKLPATARKVFAVDGTGWQELKRTGA